MKTVKKSFLSIVVIVGVVVVVGSSHWLCYDSIVIGVRMSFFVLRNNSKIIKPNLLKTVYTFKKKKKIRIRSRPVA